MNLQNEKNKIIACLLSGTLTLTALTGCKDEKNGALDDSIFENAVVVTFEDGTRDIANEKVHIGLNRNIFYYESLVTHLRYASPEQLEECPNTIKHIETCLNIYKVEDYIADYLTNDELIKIYNDELTENETKKIFDRILKSENQKVRNRRK